MSANANMGPSSEKPNLLRGIVQRMAQVLIQSLIVCVLLFVSAGRLDWPWAWAYIGTSTAILGFNLIVFLSRDPEMVAERGRIKRGQTKGWDNLLTRVMIIPAFGAFIVIGLDKRFGWYPAYAPAIHLVALLVWALGQLTVTWAMASNKFFEQTARIQDERQQTVAAGGAYRLVRHPGYTGMIIGWLAFPVALGSWWGFIPAVLSVVCFVVRTAFEDKMLQEELPGYKEYTQQTRYRLLPGVW
jgi:protein-S-isoprenylcysteine O-methyltransferase Ste14